MDATQDLVIAGDNLPNKGGRPPKYPDDIVERALLQVALGGGAYTKAHRELAEQGIDIPVQTLQNWCKVQHRNRYGELRSQASHVLEEEVAARATELALRAADIEERALKQIAAELADTDAVGASVVLRNVSGSKAVQVDKAGAIRGRPTQVIDHRGFDELAQALVRMGAADIVEGTAEDVPDAEAV